MQPTWTAQTRKIVARFRRTKSIRSLHYLLSQVRSLLEGTKMLRVELEHFGRATQKELIFVPLAHHPLQHCSIVVSLHLEG